MQESYWGAIIGSQSTRQGYYQQTMKSDCMEFTKKCDKCQRFAPMSKAHPKKLTTITSPQPFIVQGTDLISQLPKERGGAQYAVVAMDYFTKYVEVEALASITPMKIKEFVYRNIICWYGVSHTIISNNDKQFDCNEFKEFCDNLQIKKSFSSVAQPQANGQVEAINKTIKHNIIRLRSLKFQLLEHTSYVI